LQAYGHSCPPPVAAVPDDNVIIGNVANFLLRSDMLDRGSPGGAKCRDRFAQWGKITKMNFWRPNTGSPVGWQWGLPDVPLTRTIKDMQYAAEHNWMGIYVDYVREHWSTQGPMNYLMAQLTWNPHQDGQAILKDYYRRAFGPAAAEMEAYWKYMEQLREECFGHEKIAVSAHDISEFYNVERLDKAEALLRGALDKAAKAPDVYRRRIEFVIVGLDFTRLLTECGRLMKIMNKHEDQNDAASEQIRVNWKKMRSMQKSHPNALRWNQIFSGPDASGPPSPKLAGKFHPGPRP